MRVLLLLAALQAGSAPPPSGPPADAPVVRTDPGLEGTLAPPDTMRPPLRVDRFPAPVAALDTVGAGDRWLAPDKAKHFFLSFAATSLAHGALGLAGVDGAAALGGAGAAALAAGAWKELRDRRIPGETASTRDLVWDALGVAAALAVLAGT